MKTKLIGISGKLKHGKDTLANYVSTLIKVNTSYNVVKLSFSDPIKEAVKIIMPNISNDDLWGPSQNRSKIIENYINPKTGNKLTIRDCLTSIGAWGRSCNVDCWANATIQKANKAIYDGNIVIISDCRYKNEKNIIEKNNGVIIRIVRPSVGYTTDDPSEIDLDDVKFDNVVINNNYDDLLKEADKIVKNFIL